MTDEKRTILINRMREDAQASIHNAITREAGSRASNTGVRVGFPATVKLEDLEILYKRDRQARREVDKLASDPLKSGIRWESTEENHDDMIVALDMMWSKLSVALREGMRMALLYGWSIIYCNYRDGGRIDQPVQNPIPYSEEELCCYRVITRREIKNVVRDTDPTSETYDEPQSYEAYQKGTGGGTYTIHADRCLLIDWGDPYLEASYNLYMVKNNVEWSMGEAYWRNAAPLNETRMPADATIDEYERVKDVFASDLNASTHLISPPGYELVKHPGTIADPKSITEYLMSSISSLPKTILYGTDAGAITGSETNLALYWDDLGEIQETIHTPIIDAHVACLQDFGLIPAGRVWHTWPPLWQKRSKDEADELYKRALTLDIVLGKGGLQLPTMSIEEARKLLFPELDDIPPSILSLWGQLPSPTENVVARRSDGSLLRNRLDDFKRREMTEYWYWDPTSRERNIRLIYMGYLAALEDMVVAWVLEAWKLFGPEMVPPEEQDKPSIASPINRMWPLLKRATQRIRRRSRRVDEYDPAQYELFRSHLFSLRIERPAAMLDELVAEYGLAYEDSGGWLAMRMGIEEWTPGNPQLAEFLQSKADMASWQWYSKIDGQVKGAIMDGITRGQSIADIRGTLSTIFDAKESDYDRIARTVLSEVTSEADREVFTVAGAETVIFLVTSDEATCEECMMYDGREYPLSEMSLIPVHPSCRCTWIPVTVDQKPWG